MKPLPILGLSLEIDRPSAETPRMSGSTASNQPSTRRLASRGTRLQLVTLLALALNVVPALAEVYRWVDENGEVHFGDRPPKSATADAEKIRVQTTPSADPHTAERRARAEKLSEAYAEDRKALAKSRADAKAEAKKRKQACAQARKELSDLENANFIYVEGENGERDVLDGERYDAALAQARAWAKQNCES